ncbi:hypothetical protein, partial [Rodentibacter rarus]|uniref:hypothetical protein n=1 Tax=Rodentibacter rarus TaxID=1908260 RepID=UPI001C4E1027
LNSVNVVMIFSKTPSELPDGIKLSPYLSNPLSFPPLQMLHHWHIIGILHWEVSVTFNTDFR